MSSETGPTFDADAAWITLRDTAKRMGEADDPAIYDALKAQFDHLVADLKKNHATVPEAVLADPLLRTQFVPKAQTEISAEGLPVEVVDELFGMKIAPRAIPSVVAGVVVTGDIEVPEDYVPPTVEQLAEIDNLIRQSKVAQMRNNREEAASLLKQAEGIAPFASSVLEAIGDELMAARKTIEARKYYDRARKVDPANTSAEKKYADTVFRTDASKFTYNNMDDAEIVADPKKAAMLSYFLPGVGQLVTGSTVKGAVFLVLVLGSAIGAVKLGLMSGVTRMIGGSGSPGGQANLPIPETHPFAYVLAVVAILVYVVNVADIVSRAKVAGKRSVDRPLPPENLPFE